MTGQDGFRFRLWLPVVLALALAGAAAAGMAARASASATKVTVVKVTEKEFSLAFSVKTFKPGAYEFMAMDRGKFPHTLEISGPGVHNKRIPHLLNAGQHATLRVTLRTGTYHVWCPVPGHAAKGMKATIVVGGSPAAGGTSTPTPTTTTSGGGTHWG